MAVLLATRLRSVTAGGNGAGLGGRDRRPPTPGSGGRRCVVMAPAVTLFVTPAPPLPQADVDEIGLTVIQPNTDPVVVALGQALGGPGVDVLPTLQVVRERRAADSRSLVPVVVDERRD